jgi:hypothetical protein
VLAADIHFDPAGHRYTVAGERWPSVTEVLDPLLELDGIPRAVLKAAAEFGTHVHMATDLFDKGVLDEPALDPHLAPYLAGWKLFLRDTGAKVTRAKCASGIRSCATPARSTRPCLDEARARQERADRHQVGRGAAHRGPADRRLRRGARIQIRRALRACSCAGRDLSPNKAHRSDRLVDLPERSQPSPLEKQMTELDKDPAVLEVTSGIMALEQFAATYQVTTPAQYESGAADLARVKGMQKKLEETRTGITGPMNAALKKVNDFFRGPAEKLAGIERTIKAKLGGYHEAQEKLRLEEQRKADERPAKSVSAWRRSRARPSARRARRPRPSARRPTKPRPQVGPRKPHAFARRRRRPSRRPPRKPRRSMNAPRPSSRP